AALDARHVDEARGTADQRAARESERRHRLPAALVDRARAVGHAAPALEEGADRRMLLPALKLLERREPGIPVIERNDEAERDLPVGLVIEETAAPGIAKRPALGVDDAARLMPGRVNIP